MSFICPDCGDTMPYRFQVTHPAFCALISAMLTPAVEDITKR